MKVERKLRTGEIAFLEGDPENPRRLAASVGAATREGWLALADLIQEFFRSTAKPAPPVAAEPEPEWPPMPPHTKFNGGPDWAPEDRHLGTIEHNLLKGTKT